MCELAPETLATIHDTCRQFSQSMGWPLSFLSVNDTSNDTVERQLRNDDQCCWFMPVDDGIERVGYLTIGLPVDDRLGGAFPYVCDFAEITTFLLTQVLHVRRSVDTRSTEISTLANIGQVATSRNDLTESIQHLLDALIELTGFRQVALFLLDSGAMRLTARAASGLTADEIPHRVRELDQLPPDIESLTRGPYLLRRRLRPDQKNWLTRDGATALCLPVHSEAGPIGTLWTYDRRDRIPDDRERHVVESIVAQMANVMEHHVVRRERTEQERLRHDLSVASHSHAVHLDEAELAKLPVDVAVYSQSHCEVGGDLCEVIAIDDYRTVISVGDATGHSVRAAMIMSAARGCVRSLSTGHFIDAMPTGKIVEQINRSLHAMTPIHLFTSLIYAVHDCRTQQLTFTNAGHPNPFIWRDGEIEQLESHGLLLGVVPTEEYGQTTVQLQHADLLVIYSDGITEARNRARSMFRTHGITEAIDPQKAGSARAVRDGILERLRVHTEGLQDDDATLLVVRIPD